MDGLLWAWAYVLAKAVQSDSTVRRLPVSWAFASPPLVFYCIFLYLSGFVRCSKLHVYCRNNQQKYAIRYEPNAVCWSQAPTSLKDLMKQRRRWHLGLFQSMVLHRQIFANPRFGLVSWISYMYYLLFELLSPAIEVFGILTMVLAACFGFLNVPFMLRYFLFYAAYGAAMTMTAFFQRIYTQNLRIMLLDAARALAMCFMESLFFRYVLSFVRVTSFIGYKRKKNQWGAIKRVKQQEWKA